ncbi:MAG: hypothetical protein RLZZ318_308, partial [Bacteroidota bacterium]
VRLIQFLDPKKPGMLLPFWAIIALGAITIKRRAINLFMSWFGFNLIKQGVNLVV